MKKSGIGHQNQAIGACPLQKRAVFFLPFNKANFNNFTIFTLVT